MTFRSRLWGALAALFLLLICAAGTGVAAWRGWQPAYPVASPQAPAAGIVDAQRAAGEAQAQAGFLNSGTKQLADGVAELDKGAVPLSQGTKDAVAGAQQLADGLVQLQAGTGQLGDGATRVADGVGTAVDQIVGVNAVRGQLIAAIDGTLKDLEGNKSPEANNIRTQLRDLRAQADNFQLDPALTAQLKELKEGSRELANQLDVPGYAYHDGIYEATVGAQRLRAGLTDLDKGVGEARGGIGKLKDGADKVAGMAKTNDAKVGAVRAALPAAQPADAPATFLAPAVAALVGSLALLGGLALGYAWAAGARWWAWWLGALGVAAGAAVGVFVLATGLDTASLGVAAGVLLLTVLASAAGTRLAIGVLGKVGGLAVAGLLAVGQLALVGWLWQAGSLPAWGLAAFAVPLQWSTMGVMAVANPLPHELMWGGVGLLATLATLGLTVSFALGRGKKAGRVDSGETLS